jgi:glutathione-regulated potassium-efflux system ancillary protein KefG
MVLEFGWAYGPNADALQDKICLNVITTGGSKEIYCSKGTNRFTVNQFLRPFEQTANSCGMSYLPPFAVMGTHHLSKENLADYANQYSKLIELLQQDFTIDNCAERYFLNDILELKTS